MNFCVIFFFMNVKIIIGADGGSIPTREDLVKVKKHQEKPEQKFLDRPRWFYCALSDDPLQTPIVVDELGNLLNKEAVIKALLDKSIASSSFKHIRNLKVRKDSKNLLFSKFIRFLCFLFFFKDVFQLSFKQNPHYKPVPKKGETTVVDVGTAAPFICPITGLEVGGSHK